MKRLSAVVLLALVCSLFCVPAQAQITQNPNSTQLYYITTITAPAAGKSYANSQLDTLPQPTTAGVSTGYKLGGASAISLTITPLDSMAADVYVDYKLRSSTTWVTAYADSVITSSNTGTKSEIIIRSSTLDRLGKIDCDLRVRVAHRSAGSGTTTKTYIAILNWKS